VHIAAPGKISVAKNIDVMFGIPCYDRKVYVETALAITYTAVELMQARARASLYRLGGCALVTHARNAIVGEFLSRKDKTHLLFVDADMEWSPNTVLRLLKADVPFAAAPYVQKRYRNAPTSSYRPKDLDSFHAAVVNWNVVFDDPEIISGKKKLADLRSGFAKVKRVGAGLMLLRRDMLETMARKYADTEYRFDGQMDGQVSSKARFFGLFDLLKSDQGSLIGEDYSFCDRWVQGCGGEIWCDTEARIVHHGHHRYTGSLQESLKLRARIELDKQEPVPQK
jgi:hypothetical protein